MWFSFAFLSRFWHFHRVRQRSKQKPGPRVAGGLMIGLLSFVCFACAIGGSNGTNFRQDVLLCEEAVAHLQDCCPDLGEVYPETCEYRDDGCNNGRNVAFDLRTSRCIRDKDCNQLVSSGTCARAGQITAASGVPDASGSGTGEICTP